MSNEHLRLRPKSPKDQSHIPSSDSELSFRAVSFEEQPIWVGLFENLREAIFPTHLPPLELTSTSIPTQDRMGVKTNPWAIGTAAFLNAGLFALLILLGLHTPIGHFPPKPPGTDISLKDFTLFAPPSTNAAHGGGSGGSHALIDPITGRMPPHVDIPLAPPQIPVIDHPLLAVEPSISVPLPDNSTLPNLGVLRSSNSQQISYGPGGPSGIGKGPGNGDGAGHGPNYGPGSDGLPYTPGAGGVSKPSVLFAPIAEFSDEARRQRYQGVCIVSIVVDAHGNPQNPRVTRSLGMGLDEKALEAVQKYRFKPAMKDGKPVASYVSVEVDFHLY